MEDIKQKEAQAESIRTTIDSSPSSIDSYSDPDFLDNQVNDKLSGLIQNPISSILNKTVTKINNLTSVVENKINRLAEDLIKSIDKKGSHEAPSHFSNRVSDKSYIIESVAAALHVTDAEDAKVIAKDFVP